MSLPASLPESNLVSYGEVIDHLKKRGYGKNFFNTLRTRHKVIHKPFIKPRSNFVIPGLDVKVRQGRLVYYLREIIPFLDTIMLLREEELTFKQIKEKVEPQRQRLEMLRKMDFADDKRVKPAEFFDEVRIAARKFKDCFGWGESSMDVKYLHHILSARLECAREYSRLTMYLRDNGAVGATLLDSDDEREKLGRKIDYYHGLMEAVIKFRKIYISEGLRRKAGDARAKE